MRIIACINLWNERAFIERCIDGLWRADIHDIIIVDGRYRGFPGKSWYSDDGTWEWLQQHAAPKGLTVVPPPENGWPGQEVKRSAYFREADRIAAKGDWLLQVDADEILVESGECRGRRVHDFLRELDGAPQVFTVYVHMRECDDRGEPYGNWGPYPKLLRWEPGLYYGNEHWDIHSADGKRRYPPPDGLHDVTAQQWFALRFHHLSDTRGDARKLAKGEYEAFRCEYRRKYGSMNPDPKVTVEEASASAEKIALSAQNKLAPPERDKLVRKYRDKVQPRSLEVAEVLRGQRTFSMGGIVITPADRIVRDREMKVGLERVGEHEVRASEEEFMRIGTSWPADVRIEV